MISSKLIFACLCVLAISIASRTPMEIQQWILTQAIDCKKEFSVSAEDMQMMLELKLPDSSHSKCYIACVLKKIQWINDNGDYDFDKAIEFAEREYTNNATEVNNATVKENAKKLFENCKSVNSEPVTDGKSGCDRAFLLSKCLIENSPKMGFNI